MSKPVTIPNTFATQTGNIPLSQLDSNFTTLSGALNDYLTYANYATDSGTVNAISITLSPVPASQASLLGVALAILVQNTNTAATTLNANAFGAQNIVDMTGSNINSGSLVAGIVIIVIWNGTNYVWQGINPVAALPSIVRQTIYNGPVDSNGLPNFGGSTGSTVVTASGTLYASSANGSVNRLGSIVNPSWTGLSTNGTMYLYLTVNSNGSCTTGSTTVQPIFQYGGSFSNTSGAFVFNIAAMTGNLGTGAANAQAYIVFAGEVTVAGGVVTAITWYALNGQYDSGYTATFPAAATSISKNHNIACYDSLGFGSYIHGAFRVKCLTAEGGFSIGDVVEMPLTATSASTIVPFNVVTGGKTIQVTTGVNTSLELNNKSTGAGFAPTLANWAYAFSAKRIF